MCQRKYQITFQFSLCHIFSNISFFVIQRGFKEDWAKTVEKKYYRYAYIISKYVVSFCLDVAIFMLVFDYLKIIYCDL